MSADAFDVLAEPMRRRILGELLTAKHLRVLRESGFVSCATRAQKRIYRIEPEPLRSLDAWLKPYRKLWARHLDALERHLDRQVDA
jgi:predicted transcriptional regulator